MAGNTFHLVITSVTGALFDGEASAVTLPATGGEITILKDHEPLVATLKQGTARVKAGDEIRSFDIKDGVVEASGSNVTVLL